MKELVFDTSIETFNINGVWQIRFNPTDSRFSRRLFDAFTELEEKYKHSKHEMDITADKRKVFELMDRLDGEMRVIIDNVLGEGASEAIFGNTNVYAMSDGLPLWTNLFLCIMEECNDSFAREQKATNHRVKKYTEKYHKK